MALSRKDRAVLAKLQTGPMTGLELYPGSGTPNYAQLKTNSGKGMGKAAVLSTEGERIVNQSSQPRPGQIYQHRKHDPGNGKWHEYEVVGVVSPPPEGPRYMTTMFLMGSCTHTESGDVYQLRGCRNKIYADPPVDCPHVAYKSTEDASGKIWLRPLDMFMDGRFTLVENPTNG